MNFHFEEKEPDIAATQACVREPEKITSQGPWKEETDQLMQIYQIEDDATKNEAKYMLEQQITKQIIE